MNTYNMLILDKNFKQLIKLRKLVQHKYAMHVDTCFDVDLAIVSMAKSSYQYLLLNGQQFGVANVFRALEASNYQGKVIVFNHQDMLKMPPSENFFYLPGPATEQNLDPLMTFVQEHNNQSFNEKELLQKALCSA